MDGEIILEREGPVAQVTISRPSKLNSVTWEMLESFDDLVENLVGDSTIRVILFTGAGERAFSAGFDLKTVKALAGESHYRFFKTLERAVYALRGAGDCVTIAAARGYVIGFGAILSLACDIRFFSEDAVFRLPEVDIDILPAAGAASGLVGLVGPSTAKDILLSGRPVPADEAASLGIANRVLPPDEVLQTAREYAEHIARKNHAIIGDTKRMVDRMIGRDTAGAQEVESEFLESWLRSFHRDV